MKNQEITAENINQFIKVMDGEQWKTAADYPNYLISSYGRCFSLYHRKIITPILCADKKVLQYYCYKLTKDKKSRWVRVHRLVAKTFIENPEGKREVHHKDGNTLNNHVENLRWINRKEHLALHREKNKVKATEAA